MGPEVINFLVLETFTAAPLNLVSGITDLELVARDGEVMLYSATRAGGGVLANGGAPGGGAVRGCGRATGANRAVRQRMRHERRSSAP